ncbi:Tyrosine recombinase XerC [uncultured archaeon]|nr:Tyrosine recombinase XerC [uncultured archaeon]
MVNIDINDSTFQAWIEPLQVHNSSTAVTYKTGLLRFCEFTKKTPGQLLEEARQDYLNRVPPWELRHIKAIENFILNLKKTNLVSDNTKITWLKGVKRFYTDNKIPLTKINTGISSSPKEEYVDLPTLKVEDVRKAVEACGLDKMRRALILALFSSGQGQSEIRRLKGRHLKNVVNGVAVVNTYREKDISKRRYTFFISSEALAAIKEYKPGLKDDEYVFTQKVGGKPLIEQEVVYYLGSIEEKCKFPKGYLKAHRVRHYFKSTLTGKMDSVFIEYIMGHKLRGVEGSYFKGDEKTLLEAYLKNQQHLSIFTDHEVMQREYDGLKKENEALKSMFTENMIRKMIDERMAQIMAEKG